MMIKNLITLQEVTFSYPDHPLFDAISFTVPIGKITAIMGPSGTGKTTLLKLISGQLSPQKGSVWFEQEQISTLNRRQLYEVRKKMSMLFQSGALFTDLTLFDNVAFPLREHTQLPEAVIRTVVLLKLEAVGLRGASQLMPAALSGGMARRVALARAMALDPALILFDEPFVGQDPITLGVLIKLIKDLNQSLGITCVIVSHDIATLSAVADYGYIIAEQQIVAQGTLRALQNCDDARTKQFLNGIADGPVPFHYPAIDYATELFHTCY